MGSSWSAHHTAQPGLDREQPGPAAAEAQPASRCSARLAVEQSELRFRSCPGSSGACVGGEAFVGQSITRRNCFKSPSLELVTNQS